METDVNKQVLEDSNSSRPTDIEVALAQLLPNLYYAVNRVLEDSAPGYNKKTGVVLLALMSSTMVDELGPFLTTSEISRLFRDRFVASQNSAKSETSKVKRDLFALNLVKTEGGVDHIHLNEKGEKAAREQLMRAISLLRVGLQVLSREEQAKLLEFGTRLMNAVSVTMKKSPTSVPSDPEGAANSEAAS